MQMNKSVLNVLVLSIGIAALAAAGCGKDKKDESKDKATAGETKAGGDAPGAARAQAGGSAASAFALFPKDSNMVAGINVSALRGTPLWNKFAPLIQQQAGSELKEFTAACGIDPFNAIDSVVVGGNSEDDKNMVIAIKGNLEKGKVIECAKKIAAKDGTDLKIEEDGQIVGFVEGGEQMYVAWLDDGTIVTGPGAEGNKDWLEGVLSGGASVTGNKAFMDLVNNTDSNSSVWFAIIPPAGDNPFNAMGAGGPKPDSMYASINLGKGLKIDAGLRFAKPDDAKMLADQANQMMGPMKSDPTFGKYLAKTAISTSGNDVVVKVDLNQAEFDELLKMLEQQLPMLMMMAGGM
jgi:hypothetical protein